MRFSFALFTCLMVANIVPAQTAPTGPPPVFKLVRAVEKTKGHIVFLETVTRVVPVQVQIVEIVNGQQVAKVVTRHTYVQEQRLQSIQAANSRVIAPDGKQLPIDEVWNRLKGNMVVAVSADGNTPAAVYLKALNANTLVIIPPRSAVVQPVVPRPMPIPVPKDASK